MMQITDLQAVSSPLPWQDTVWARLEEQMTQERLPHALLLSGPRHIGKARLALALARKLLCEEPVDGLNCGHCRACLFSANGSHGDFRWLQPEEKSRVIKVDQVRALVEFTTKTAGFGKRKVVVIDPADEMNMNAANALLKSLEEPAPDTFLLLICDRLQKVPATVRSRCQIVHLAMPGHDAALAWLDLAVGDPQQSEMLLQLAEGRPLLADQLLREDSAAGLVELREQINALLTGRADVDSLVTTMVALGPQEALAHLVLELQRWLRALPGEQLAGGLGQAGFGLLSEITRLQGALQAGANPNPQLMLEVLVARAHRELGMRQLGGSI
tara:strand:+ start:34475 stop:35461 length:987 start_codon:yes stop_codon:yes gene_type:complete